MARVCHTALSCRVVRAFVFNIAARGLLSVVAPTQAATVAECQTAISNLRTGTVNAPFIGQNAAKVQAGLVSKLDTVALKLEQGKVDDTVQALTRFRDKVVTLETQGKILSGDAQTLIAGANEAIACVQSLTTTQG